MNLGPIYIIRNTFPTLLYALLFLALNYSENTKTYLLLCIHNENRKYHYHSILTLLHCYLLYRIAYHSYFTYIYTLCLTTTRWSWGHKNEELFSRLLEEERKELFRLFPESSILTPSFPHGENLLLLQHSALGVPTWHTCLVSSAPRALL
jgi:hypothetical protein